jgi:hypothetical protein
LCKTMISHRDRGVGSCLAHACLDDEVGMNALLMISAK